MKAIEKEFVDLNELRVATELEIQELLGQLSQAPLNRSVQEAAQHVMDGFGSLELHPDVAMFAAENESDLMGKLEKSVGFTLELRDDPLLRPDEFKLVVKSAGRDVTQQYAVA